MKNNLIIFGDSFSTHFTTNNSVVLEESWPVLLSKKLNLNLINNALPGASNGEITNEIFKKYDDIKDDDIVILEIGFFNRILEQFSGTTFMLGYNDDRFDELDFKFYTRKVLNMDSATTHILHKPYDKEHYVEMVLCSNIEPRTESYSSGITKRCLEIIFCDKEKEYCILETIVDSIVETSVSE